MRMVCKYITEFSKQWKSKYFMIFHLNISRIKLAETTEKEFETFESVIPSSTPNAIGNVDIIKRYRERIKFV